MAERSSERPFLLSVVIPALNEAAHIADQLKALGELSGIDEILVVDGGSDDDTVAIAERHAGARVISAPRGRGQQLNAGARSSRGDALLFLHADCRLPADAAAWVRRALGESTVVGGAFRIRTVPDGVRSWVVPFLWLADLRSRVTRFPYGDQAIFVRRAAFEAVGGFPHQPLMEDLELSRRLRQVGRLRTLPAVVTVSGRRFVRHPWRSVLLMRVLPLLYRLGVSPIRLAAWYGEVR